MCHIHNLVVITRNHLLDLDLNKDAEKIQILHMIGYAINALFRIMIGVKPAKNVLRLGQIVILFLGLKIGNVQNVVILIMPVVWNVIAVVDLKIETIDSILI